MPSAKIQLPEVIVSGPDAWLEFRDGGSVFYADPLMVRDKNGKPLKPINKYKPSQEYLILQNLGLRTPTDREYNRMVNENPAIAEQMRYYSVFTSFLKKVERIKKGYTALYIARPEIKETDEGLEIVGSEKRIKLPKDDGWFKISELLQSETGLPERTYTEIRDEPCAYFWISEGKEMPVCRGHEFLIPCIGDRCFYVDAGWRPSHSRLHSKVGIRAVNDKKLDSPIPQNSRV